MKKKFTELKILVHAALFLIYLSLFLYHIALRKQKLDHVHFWVMHIFYVLCLRKYNWRERPCGTRDRRRDLTFLFWSHGSLTYLWTEQYYWKVDLEEFWVFNRNFRTPGEVNSSGSIGSGLAPANSWSSISVGSMQRKIGKWGRRAHTH